MQFSDTAPARRPAPFASLPPRARLTYAWAAPLLAVAFLGVANIASIPVLIPLILMDFQQIVDTGTVELTPLILAATVIVSFSVFAATAVGWARLFERRGPATLGFIGGPRLYVRGLGAGVLLAALLLGMSAVAAPEDLDVIAAGLRRLMAEAGAPLLLVMFGLFVLQTGAEEVVFRGWMLSSVAARRGPLVGVAVSSAGFALVHAHYLVFAPLSGLFAVIGVGMIGAILAFYALGERSVWGVCGLHCAYNFLVMVTATAQALGEQPDLGPIEVVMTAVSDITSITEFDPGLVASAVVLALIAAGAWLLWRRTGSARRAAA